jgi:hypothetical protein
MSRPVPIAGFPSYREAVRSLKDAGLTEAEISVRLGLSLTRIRSLRAPLRDRGMSQNARICVPVETLRALQMAARRRRMAAATLAEKLLVTIARDGLVEAILDDAEDAA